MNTLQQKLASAVQLRETGKHDEARELLRELHSEFPNDAQVNLQYAWIHDLLGLERDAIQFYESAVKFGLSGDDLQSALLGMGSTYRLYWGISKSEGNVSARARVISGKKRIQSFPGDDLLQPGGTFKVHGIVVDQPC